MKKKALIITIGTGVGEHVSNGSERLVQSLLKSIRTHNPEFIVFFGTAESKEKTFRLILRHDGVDIPQHEFVVTRDLNDVDTVYREITTLVKKLRQKEYHVTIDFTSGTKAMSAGAVLAASNNFCTISYISGPRGSDNLVIHGKERILTSEPVEAFLDAEELLLQRLFNANQFQSALSVLEQMSQVTSDSSFLERCGTYQKLFSGYAQWDIFNHASALEILRTVDHPAVNNTKNKQFLIAVQKEPFKEKCLIPDLINNAWRRIEEGKYDDAVARLYRCIEMVAQYRLKKKHGLDPSMLRFDDLRTKINHPDKYVMKQDAEGIIKIALRDAYLLLQDLGDDAGKAINDSHLKDLLQKRNFSILAHGTIPVTQKQATAFHDITKQFASSVVDDFEQNIKNSCFPRLL